MRLPLITAALLASLALPYAAMAQDEDEDEDVLAGLIANPMPQFDIGDEDNGWFLTRGEGSCRMYSFNDALALEADATDAAKSVMQFQMIDGDIAEQDGAAVQLRVIFREKPGAQTLGYPVTATVKKDMVASYAVTMPMKDLATRFPDGFEVLLVDEARDKVIVRSDTMGSRKHLAALAACEKQ